MTDGSLPQPKPELQVFHQRVLRIVESQEQIATTKIVANLEEQDLLETMLEGSKPVAPEAGLHYLFAVPLQSGACVVLRQPPFADRQCDLRSVTRYADTQAVGTQLRELGAEMLLFASARAEGLNAGLFTPALFAGCPRDQFQWHSEVDALRVAFRGPEGVFCFPLEQFADHMGKLDRIQG